LANEDYMLHDQAPIYRAEPKLVKPLALGYVTLTDHDSQNRQYQSGKVRQINAKYSPYDENWICLCSRIDSGNGKHKSTENKKEDYRFTPGGKRLKQAAQDSLSELWPAKCRAFIPHDLEMV
jgi:hypothetical protein